MTPELGYGREGGGGSRAKIIDTPPDGNVNTVGVLIGIKKRSLHFGSLW